MTSSDDASRAAILRRRALFISSVTALSGCGPSTPTQTPEPAPSGSSPVVSVAPGPGGELPPPQGTAVEPSTKPAPTKPGEMPPLDTPSGINEVATQRFDWLRESLTKLYAQIDKLEQDLPRDCAMTDSACDARWQAVAKELLVIEERSPRSPVCKGSSEGAKLYEARVAEHQAYVGQRKEDINRQLKELVKPHGKQGEERWEAHMAAARASFPRVCLNYSCKDW